MTKKNRPHGSPHEGPAPAEAAPPVHVPAPEEVARLVLRAAQADDLEDRLKRAQAEFVNESRRIARQAEQDRKFAIEQVVRDLVPLAEALKNALTAVEGTEAGRRLGEGLEIVSRQLHEVLDRHGVEPIEAAGLPFNPALHEAVLVVDRPDLPPQTVAEILRPGFLLHGRVVRPAQVAVTRAAPVVPSPEPSAAEAAPGAPGPDGEDA